MQLQPNIGKIMNIFSCLLEILQKSIGKLACTDIQPIIKVTMTMHAFFACLFSSTGWKPSTKLKYKFLPKNKYNSTVQDPGKISPATGQKGEGSIISWERGKKITFLCTMSAAGGYVRPIFIFSWKRAKWTLTLENDGPTGEICKCWDNGWINEELFLEWLQHFTPYAKPSAEEPIRLVLDNYVSHISLGIFQYCKKNYFHMLSLSPHTSYHMQPILFWSIFIFI